MKSGRSVLPGAYAAKARGLLLCALTAGTAYVYYLALDADDAIPPAAADVIPPRAMKASERINGPVYALPDSATRAVAAPPSARSSGITVKIQTALANARCYDGPVTGDWTPASQAAMTTFLRTVKAQLPVADPDPALLTLLTAHAHATCGSNLSIATGSLNAQERAAKPSEPSRLDRAWAPPEMLIPPRETASPQPATASLADNDVMPVAASASTVVKVSSAGSNSELKIEDENAVAVREPNAVARPASAHKAIQRKTRTAKRRASRHSKQAYGVDFDSIQRSISSLFE